MRRGRRALLALASLAGAGCGGVRVADSPLAETLAWPPGEPRVRLERVVQLQNTRTGLAGFVGGREQGAIFEGPHGVAFRGDDLLITEPAARRVTRVAADGRIAVSPEGAVGAPVGLAACPRGVVVADSEGGRVGLLGSDLRLVRWLATGLQRPTGVACLGDTVFVAETGAHRIVALEPNGATRVLGGRGSEAGRFNYPTALAAGTGTLFVGDTLNFRVQLLDPASGACLGMFGQIGDSGGDMPRLKGLALDSMGHLWVSDGYLDVVSLYTRAGELLMSLGGPGARPGQFSFPAGLASHADGRVAVVDALNRRVQVFRVLGGTQAQP